MNNRFNYKTILGNLCIEEEDGYITGVYIDKNINNTKETKVIRETYNQLNDYFMGKRRIFDVPLKFNGTEFQNKVWKALLDIPYGETKTYGEIAKAIGNPKGSRAVGNANNKNSIMIIVPCHRVIGSKGNLVGYEYGLDVKQRLLNLEKEFLIKNKE